MAAIDEPRRRHRFFGPYLISDKLTQFLSEAYLGPLYDNGTVGERIGAYLYFLNPDDPFYRITPESNLTQLLFIYQRANDIQFQDKEGVTGKNSDTQIRNYFGDEYNKVFQKYADHQREHGEIVGRRRKFNFNDSPSFGIVRGVTHQLWWVPTMLSDPIITRIASDNTESYEIEDDEEYDDYFRKSNNLQKALQKSSRSMDNHPEVTDAATPFKTITHTLTKAAVKR